MDEMSPDDQLHVDVVEEGPCTIVRVAGEVDIAASDALRQAIAAVYHRGAGHTVVFDLAAATFFDSSGLAVLVSVAQDGRTVVLRNPSDPVRLVVRASGLAQLLGVEP